MARVGPTDLPTSSHGGPNSDAIYPPVENAILHEIVVRETHIAALSSDASARDIWSATVAKLPRVPPNTCVKLRKNLSGTRPEKRDIMDFAFAQSPHLVKKAGRPSRLGNQAYMYRFLALHIERF